ncbi:MAG: activator of HSP90 ATPase [Bacteroidetes bacterium]|nr:MAG: activator of HSP90 ATPase [Bacteroidota bacterium]
MNNQNENKTVTIQKTFNAPLKLVWEAWTQPEHIAHWWGPKGMDLNVIEHNFEVGGTWKYTMMMPNGNEFISQGKYTEITEYKRIVTSADFKPMTEGVILEAIFEQQGDTTLFTFNIVHPTEEYRIQQEKMGILNGWGSVLERLAELVNTLSN